MSDTNRHSNGSDDGAPPTKPPTATRPVASISVESLCALLADPRVRAVLRAFERASESALEQPTVVDALVSTLPHARVEVSIQLRHLLLPKLTDVGVLEHEAETSQIQYDPEPRLSSLFVHAHKDSRSIQNRLFGALGHPQRRTILSGLVDADDTCALTSLSLILMGDEEGHITPLQSDQEFQRARTILVHKHLPRLVASDLVTYRIQSEVVALTTTPAARRLPKYLATLDAIEIE